MTAPARIDISTRPQHTSHEPWQVEAAHVDTTVTADVWHDGATGAWRWRARAGDVLVAWGVSPDEGEARSAAARHLEAPAHPLLAAGISP